MHDMGRLGIARRTLWNSRRRTSELQAIIRRERPVFMRCIPIYLPLISSGCILCGDYDGVGGECDAAQLSVAIPRTLCSARSMAGCVRTAWASSCPGPRSGTAARGSRPASALSVAGWIATHHVSRRLDPEGGSIYHAYRSHHEVYRRSFPPERRWNGSFCCPGRGSRPWSRWIRSACIGRLAEKKCDDIACCMGSVEIARLSKLWAIVLLAERVPRGGHGAAGHRMARTASRSTKYKHLIGNAVGASRGSLGVLRKGLPKVMAEALYQARP